MPGTTKESPVQKTILSCSFGKDSTAMIHIMQEAGERIDKLIYFESGWDFPEMTKHIQQVQIKTGLEIVRVRYYRHFNEMLGVWGWPHPKGGWCTRCKINVCNQIFRALHGTVECIGFTTNEIHRSQRPEMKKKKWPVRFPLIEHGFSEKDSLKYCIDLGYNWSGLYDVFNRVSCFCCPKAGKKQVEQLKLHFPKLYIQYLQMNKIANKH